VVEAKPDKDGLVYKKINGIKTAACIYHKGAYENLGKSYAILFKWIEENGYKVLNNCRELFCTIISKQIKCCGQAADLGR